MYQIDYRKITTYEGGIWPWHLRSCYWAIVKCLFAKVPNALNRSRVHQFAMPYWWCEVVNYQNHPQKFVIFSTLNNFKPDFKLKKINFGIGYLYKKYFIHHLFFFNGKLKDRVRMWRKMNWGMHMGRKGNTIHWEIKKEVWVWEGECVNKYVRYVSDSKPVGQPSLRAVGKSHRQVSQERCTGRVGVILEGQSLLRREGRKVQCCSSRVHAI